MSEEREVTDVASGQTMTMGEALKLDPEETKKLRREKKARLASVLERGLVADRLQVDLPPDLYGEWVPNDPAEVLRMQTLGFEIDTKYAPARALHSKGSGGGSVIGDTIFMVTDRETKDILNEIREEEYSRAHGKPGTVKAQKEEKEFSTQTQQQGLPVVEESKTRAARKAELEAVLHAKAVQRAEAAGGQVIPQGVSPAYERPEQPKPKGNYIIK